MADSADKQRKLGLMLERQDEAYSQKSSGSWVERWVPGVCSHARVRCTHGDEIIGRRYRRRVCMVCGRSLEGPLPVECFFTGAPHADALTKEANDGSA